MTDHNQPTGRFEDTVGYWALLGSVPPGDDTPVPTAGQWTASGGEGSMTIVSRIGGPAFAVVRHGKPAIGLAEMVADALNRAEAAPDLTALDPYEIGDRANVPYAETKRVLAAVAALVRDTPDGDDG